MPSLNLAIRRLVSTGTDNFAIWVVKAPYPSGYVHHDCVWSASMNQAWQEWQELFAEHSNLNISPNSYSFPGLNGTSLPPELLSPTGGRPQNYAGLLMQHFGNSLWKWVFDQNGPIPGSLECSHGIAMGQGKSLRLRMEIRDPLMVSLPWEIMQPIGKPAISLNQNILFSRTTSEVEKLPQLRVDPGLNVLLVLGENDDLQLQEEARTLQKTLTLGNPGGSNTLGYAPCMVRTLIQPTPEQLIAELETRAYNVLFYAGHGMRGADGGILLLGSGSTLTGIELAQVLTRTGIKLAVLNSCWGAQPAAINGQSLPHSSLTEVLIRYGVPAVLGMRDKIADHESLSFIQAFAQALRSRKAIDQAVAEARQKLLVVYSFIQPSWTLPVLYMHPEFDGRVLRGLDEDVTQFPADTLAPAEYIMPKAYLRAISGEEAKWTLKKRATRIGRTAENDIVIPDLLVSRQQAQIICVVPFGEATLVPTYVLRDESSYGTFISRSGSWERIHRQEIPLEPGMQLRFGSPEVWEFCIENS
ncbi:CHAT domain-containing protein [Calothrix sp. PCC 6303]|uniref:CHAT domain-containing protein n=1 Tax=Calothrix sp. PCC 6303 TaxID=1170562 RepID=UPI0002A04E0A|nr:CHAT domain-containing protein [Calothrix sp. PCC 6303]AFZ00325.1 Forkhead-associated protein [Calothrix sp. PCC 6303]